MGLLIFILCSVPIAVLLFMIYTISENIAAIKTTLDQILRQLLEEKKLTEKIVGGRKRWVEEGNNFGEYYILNSEGGFSIYGPRGIIRTLPKKNRINCQL